MKNITLKKSKEILEAINSASCVYGVYVNENGETEINGVWYGSSKMIFHDGSYKDYNLQLAISENELVELEWSGYSKKKKIIKVQELLNKKLKEIIAEETEINEMIEKEEAELIK